MSACAIHGTISVPLHVSATNATVVGQKPMRNIRDGPSLKDFLTPSVIDIPSEEPIPYVPDICGKDQKGFTNFYKTYHLFSFKTIIFAFSVCFSVF